MILTLEFPISDLKLARPFQDWQPSSFARGLQLLVKACTCFLPSLGWSMVLLGVFMQLGDGVAPMAHMRRRWTHWSYHLGHPGSPQAQSLKRHFTLAHTLAQVDRHFGPWQLATGFHRRWFTEPGRSPLDLESLWYSLSGDSVKGMTWMEWSLHLNESKFVMVPDCHRAGVLLPPLVSKARGQFVRLRI